MTKDGNPRSHAIPPLVQTISIPNTFSKRYMLFYVPKRNLKPRPSNPTTTHTNLQTERLAQESLASLHRSILVHLELEETEHSSADNEQFHLGDVATDTGAGTVAEGDEGGLLAGGETLGAPALGDELLSVGTPDLLGAVDRVAGDREDVAGFEGVAADHDGGGTGRDLAGKTHGGGAVDAHCFPDYPLEAMKLLVWGAFFS